MKRRALSFILVLALCLDLFPGWALAGDAGTGGGLCPHHPEHTEACGYAAPVLEQECTHIHNDDCYITKTDCIHEHTAECYPDGVSGAAEPVLCTHVCTEDGGCITKTLSCPHEHDGACGYAAGSPGAPCTFVCRICPIEDLIGRLPGSVSEQNIEQVQAQLGEIYDLYDELTGEEQKQVDLSPCIALLNQMDGMGTAALSDTPPVNGGKWDLGADETLKGTYSVSVPVTIVTNGHTLSVSSASAIRVTGTGALEIIGGAVISQDGTGVEVQSGGSLSIPEPGTRISGSKYGLDIASGAKVCLSAGRYSGKTAAIRTADGDFSALLKPGYIYFDDSGNRIALADMATAKHANVRQCTDHSSKTYTHTAGTTRHTWTCSVCKLPGEEKCTFGFTKDGIGACDCGNGVTVVVDEDDLSNLVYDGTMKPEEVKITAALTDDSNKTLVKDTDYTVVYEPRKDAGEITVTVTGITFNGTFVKTYTVEQDKPGIKWDNNSYSADYDGSAVTAGELPNVTITIKSDEDLHPYLRYAYKGNGDAGFTDGLPTNAGTYVVKAYLEGSQNYTPAETDPLLTLTINKINPIVKAPEAKTLTYNRTSQALVTAGTLDPVAVRDGLEIQFATSGNGPWSADIPTGTDAKDYEVWYKVEGSNNYNAAGPAKIDNVKIQRKPITPKVTLSEYTYLYDGGFKQPTVTVIDEADAGTILPDTEYEVAYDNNQNVSTDVKPAKVIVTDKAGGNYDVAKVEVPFQITRKPQDALSITNMPGSFTYGDKFTLGTSGGSGNGDVTWEITNGTDVAKIDQTKNGGQVIITGHGSVTVKATKSGTDPDTGAVNYEDATAVRTFTAVKKPVTATVTAEDKDYDGNKEATVHAVVEQGILPGDEITITGLTGTFSDANAGEDKTVTVVTTSANISGKNSQHYDVSYSSTTVKATIHKAIAKITTAPVAASLTYNGTAQALIGTAAVVDPADVPVEYALSETGPYSTDFPKGTNAGTYTVWYRVQETPNYTGLAPASVDVTIAKKPVLPTITLGQETFVYDGTAKEPVVTLYEADGTTLIPANEYTVAYSGNVNVGTATVTVTAKDDGNYSFTPDPVTKDFTINKEQAKVLAAPKPAGKPLVFDNMALDLVTAGTASGGTMVYSVNDENGTYSADIPTGFDAETYKVYYKVEGDDNHSDSDVGSVEVTIAPKTVKDPTIELQNADGSALVSYTYDGSAKEPKVVVKDGSTVIADTEYNIVYSDNTDAGKGTVNITDKPGGNYTVTGSATFVINKANIVFNPEPSAATLTYNGAAQELLNAGTTTGGTVLYALGTPTSEYHGYIPTGIDAGTYNVYYKVTGDKNHNDLPVQAAISVAIKRKPLTDVAIELTPDSFEYDGTVKMPAVTVKFKEGKTETVVPETEYDWACRETDPTNEGTYHIDITDVANSNFDLSVANTKTATFTIGQAVQVPLVIEGKHDAAVYGETFTLTTRGGSGTGTVTWSATGAATMDQTTGEVKITGVGEVTITATNPGDQNYLPVSDQWTFTAAPMPVTASVTVSDKPYDGTTAATVASADIAADLLTGDTVTIVPASITAAFDTPHAGTGKTVTLDASKVQVTGDTAKYAISYPDTVTADITQATTTIGTAPAAIASLTYNGQPQALVTVGQTNVGFLVYSLSENGEYSREIPTGTDAGTYTVYYKVDETTDYSGVAANTTPISVTIDPKPITPKIELSETSYRYDGTKKTPKVTLKDGDTVINENQYTVTWAGTKSQTDADLLRVADTYTATIENVTTGNNYTFRVTAAVEITPAEQAALHITGNPEHVYYGDTITTLGTTGGTGEGAVKWSVTSNGNNATIEEDTGKLTITGTGSVTVRAERSVPNYGTVGDNWNFTVEPKPVTAEVTVTAKTYDGTATIADTAITAQVKTVDLVGSDTVTLGGLKGVYTDPNAGTGKTVTLDATNATANNTDKYTVTYPATAQGDITPKSVTVTVALSDHDLQGNATDGYYYEYDGTAKTPTVTVTADGGAVLAASDYSVSIIDNKNVGDATVTVTAKAGGNYTFAEAEVKFAIRKASATLTSSPQAKDLTYNGTEQELVTVGVATGGTVMYSETGVEGSYSEAIPTQTAAGTYTVYYMVKGDANHADTEPKSVSATIKAKEITPVITLEGNSYAYDGNAQKPTVTVRDGNDEISDSEYSVSYRDNVDAGTATVTVSDTNGGNYIVNGTASFEITKAVPTVTAPTEITGLQYNGELQDLVNAGGSSDGTVVYSVNGGNYSAAIPTASAVGTYTIEWKVQGDANHSDTTPATLSVEIAKNTVTNPTITLSQDQFTYNGNQQKPTVTVYDNNSRLIPTHEYTVTITGAKSNNMVDVDTYTVTIVASTNSNYEFKGNNTRTFTIVPADQETISITGTKPQVRYGDTLQLGVTGGTGNGTVKWEIAGNTDTTLTQNGLLIVKDVNTSIKVTVTRSKDNYAPVSATWEFTAGKKPVTAEVTVAAKDWDGTTSVDNNAITATVEAADLAFTGDSITITGLTGTYDNATVGTDKTVTLDKTNVNITGTNAGKYDVTIPATTTASILAVPATATAPGDVTPSLTYDASQSQALVTPGTATGGTMVYSLDGNEFTPNIPKAKDAGTYTVYYKAQGDQNHTDSAVDTVSVTIGKQTVTPQIELSPPSGQYDGSVKRPEVTVRDGANNVIPTSEYTVVYDPATNWKDVGKHKVKVQNITGGNYIITEAEAEFEISTTAQAPLEIVNKPGLVYYGDTFTLSAAGGSSSSAVTWSVDDAGTSVVEIDPNGFVKIVGTGPATITATKAGGGNYDEATATYPLNALKKPVTATVTADDKVYDGDTKATILVTWNGLVGNDAIDTSALSGTFDNENVGTNKTVTITGDPVSDATAQKYAITIQRTTTASILKADTTAPTLTANDRVYDGTAQDLVTDGTANTLYSDSQNGVYSATVPAGTNAGTYTVWYKEKGDANHNDSEPHSIPVTISPKTLTATDITLSGNDLKTDTDGTYYYEYDGTEKAPTVVVKDGSATVSASEYTVTYSDNKNVTTAGKEATVTITDNEGGNYTVSGSITFGIRAGSAQLTSSPKANDLTYTGAAQQLVTVGTATGGHIEYELRSAPAGETTSTSFSTNIPEGTNAGAYTVDYKVVGDTNHTDSPSGSVTVIIQPRTVVSPKIAVTGTYTYDGTEQKPTGTAVTVVDGTTTIPDTEYTLSYRDNINAGTATVIVTDNNGGNYTVNGTATFEIGKAAAAVGTAPTGKTGLHYNGSAQELLATLGTATGGTMVYSLSETGEYSAAIPTGKAVGEYEIWYMVQGDSNHSNTTPVALSPKVKIDRNTVTNPTIQVTPQSVKYTGEKQTPTVTVRDNDGLLIDGSEYEVTYKDTTNNNADLTAVGTYTVTITGVADGNYTFNIAADVAPVTFTITPADQTPLTITGTRERVYYGDTIQLGTTGGNGTVTWDVGGSTIASIDANGLFKVTGVGSVTVTATSTKTGYANQTATWSLYADKKPVTALVTAASKTYNGNADATVTATLQTSDFVGTDSFTITLTGCTFEDPNAGTDRKVNVVSTNPTFAVNAGGVDNYENYAITYPATVTASIFKADIADTDVTAPKAAEDLEYTGLPQALVTAGTVTKGGTMEYSVDGTNYSTSLPTGTNAGDYDVWYRVKGDGNHKDTEGKKLDTQVTITQQTVTNPTIEFNPNGATYDSQEHKPEVIVKDAHGRVIPDSEYTVGYGSTNWKDVGDHEVTITGKADGNYSITGMHTKTFTILPAGQSPLSIVGQPGGEVQYGDVFTLSTNGGSGTGAVTWEISGGTGVAEVNSQTGRVEIKKAGGPVTITARKAAGGGYAETTATWTFSAEKRPATAIVTARNKPYDSNTTATLDVTWKDGDLLGNDSITLELTGAFDDANVGENKIVRITGTAPASDKYAVTFNSTTTASITAQAATVSGVQSGPWTYNGSEQPLLSGGSATNGTIVYSRNGVEFMETSPTETNAGKYTVYYKARGNTNYADSDVRMVEVTIQPKTVTSPAIELSTNSVTYDGTAKEPEVVSVKDGDKVIPVSEYTVSYSNNINVGTSAKVTITDVAGGNYTVSGSRNFTITAGAPALTAEPQPRDLTYTGRAQALVTAGSAVNGKVVYSLEYDGTYSTAIPRETDAGDYEVWYKVVSTDGTTETDPCDEPVEVTIAPKEVTPIIRIEGSSSYSVAYNGSAQKPDVTVYVESKLYTGLYDVSYANNINVGTAEVTVQSAEGGNYQFLAFKDFTITTGKAEFSSTPIAWQNLTYNGTAQPLVSAGTAKNNGIVLYSLDNAAYSTAIPTAINRGSYTVYAKVQGSSNYEESDVVQVPVTIGVNTLSADDLTVTLPTTNFSYTGGEVKPTVTVTDRDGNVIDSSEYTVTYSNNVNIGTATVSIKSKTTGNYSFTTSTTFQIVDASQTPLTITGKKDAVYYGDTLSLGATGGGSGTVMWSSSNTDVAEVDANSGVIQKIKTSGSVTITATKGSYTDTWTFYAQPKPVTATVYAADKVYDGNNTATLTVALSGLVSDDRVTLTATGNFIDEKAGTNKTVLITGLNGLDGIKDKYTVNYNNTTTASITPKPASVTGNVTGKSLTYNSTEQALIEVGGVTVEGGNLAYSLDGNSYTFSIPTATDVGTYPVWYKVVASGENYKDSAPVKVTKDAVISANQDTPKVQCNPSSFSYDGTEKTPTVVVLDSTGQHIIPESEYTVEFPTPRIEVGSYTITVKDKTGGNYQFGDVSATFEIMASSQAPLSITDKPANVYYGDTFYLSALGGTGNGAIQWSVEGTAATINTSGAVTVNNTGSFTVKAYRQGDGGYGDSNTDSVTFAAKPKPVTPVVTANDKSYDGNTNATLTASLRPSDLVNSTDVVTLTVNGVFASADAGTGKRVNLTGHTVEGKDAAKYTINWPDYVTATINRVDAKISAVPTGKTQSYTGSSLQLLDSIGMTVNNIGTIVYSLDQNGTYSTEIPEATDVGNYRVWYKVEDSVNYTGIAPAFVTAEITGTVSSGGSNDVVSDSDTGTGASFSVREPEETYTKLSVQEGDALVQEALAEQSEAIVIQPEVAGDATEAAVSIPASTVSKISNETNAALTVSTPIAGVTIPNAGLAALSGQDGGEGDVGVAVTRQEDGAVVLTLVSADGDLVESVPGGVTLAVPAEDVGPGTVAVLVHEDGTREVIQKSVVEDGKMNIPLNGSATVEIVDNSKSFDDVPSESWASEAITFASARELFGGTSETTFSPEQNMSRAMVATVLYRLEGQPEQAETSAYSDVGSDAWYADGVAWAAENGIVNGYGDGQFGPNDSVTREQFIVMLWRYVGSPEANDQDLSSFSDAGKVNSYALDALCWAVENGVLSGNDNGQLIPGGTATRAEAAQMLKNFLENT